MVIFSVCCDEKTCIFQDMKRRDGINPIYPNNTEKVCFICPKMYVSYYKGHKEYINR